MAISEHVEVFSSIIVGLAIGDLSTSLHRLLRNRTKVRWDWLVLVATSFQLLGLVEYWWATFGEYAHTTSLSIAQYMPEVLILVVLFLSTAAILPDSFPEEGLDLREYYRSVSRYYWALYVVFLLLVFAFNAPKFTPPGTTLRGFLEQWYLNFIMLAAALVLMISRNRRVHEVLVLALAAMIFQNFLSQTIS